MRRGGRGGRTGRAHFRGVLGSRPTPIVTFTPGGTTPFESGLLNFSWLDYRTQYLSAADGASERAFAASKGVMVVNKMTEYKALGLPERAVYDLLWSAQVRDIAQSPYDPQDLDTMDAWLTANGFPFENAYCHVAGGTKIEADRLIILTTPTWPRLHHVMNMGDPGYRAWIAYKNSVYWPAQDATSVFYDIWSTGMLGILPKSGPTSEFTCLEYTATESYWRHGAEILAIAAAACPDGRCYPNNGNYLRNPSPPAGPWTVNDWNREWGKAAKGVYYEFCNWPGAEDPHSFMPIAAEIMATGARVVFVVRRQVQDAPQPYNASMTVGNYATIADRHYVSAIANGYMMVDPDHMDLLYMDMYINGSLNPLYFYPKCWRGVYEVDIGQASGIRYVLKSGQDGVNAKPYIVYAREFQNGLVVNRFLTHYTQTNFGDSTAVTVTLPAGTWYFVDADGTIAAAPSTEIDLRNAEAAIFLRSPLGPAPTPDRPPSGAGVFTLGGTNVGTPMEGWSASAQIGMEPWAGGGAPWPTRATWGPDVRSKLVDELGITHLRMNVPPGMYSDSDYFTAAEAAVTESIWNQNRSYLRSPLTFYPAVLDAIITRVVDPMRTLVTARGFTPTVSLHLSGSEVGTNPADVDATTPTGRQTLAELVSDVFQHIYSTYGWIPDLIQMHNEPDLEGTWKDGSGNPVEDPPGTPALADAHWLIGSQLLTDKALFGKGSDPTWKPQFLVPATTYAGTVYRWIDSIRDYLITKGVGSWVKTIDFHTYDSKSTSRPYIGAQTLLKSRVASTGLPVRMGEFTGLTANALMDDLLLVPEIIQAEGFAAAYTRPADDTLGMGSYFVISQLAPPAVYWADRTKLLRNIYLYVKPGAQRKSYTRNAEITALSVFGIPWVNADGKYVVVLRADKAAEGSTIWVDGLPAGTYGINYGVGTDNNVIGNNGTTNTTSITSWDQDMTDVVLAAGSALPVTVPSIPAASSPAVGYAIITVYQKS